jgi:hypothetical protein
LIRRKVDESIESDAFDNFATFVLERLSEYNNRQSGIQLTGVSTQLQHIQ